MSIVKRFNKLKDLDELDVLIDDVNTSPHIVITDMPQSLPQGKSSFLIETGPYMREGIELQFDFVDSEGESIYLEPVSEYLEGTSRRISIEIYNDTAPGPANLIVVGELDEIPTAPGLFADTEPVPEEFQGVYNVRLTKEVIINPVAVNTQPIRFYTQPQIRVSERRLGTMERTDPPDKIQTSPFSVEGVPADGFAFKEFGTEEPKQGALAETSTKIIQSKGKTGKFSRMKKSFKAKKGKRKFSLFKRAGHIAKFNSPEQFPFSFKTTAHNFTTKEIDGSIILTSIDTTQYNQQQFNELKLTYPPSLNNSHTMSIEDIGNGSTAFVTKPFTQINADGREIILPFFGTAKTLFEPPPTASYSTVNIVSYADVLIDKMRTFSGDVFKSKIYVRPEGSFDDFKVLAELPVEAGELLVDQNSVGRGERTGYFENQADINQYWNKFGGTNGLSVSATEFSNYDNSLVLDAVKLSGSLETFDNNLRFQVKDAYKFNLTAGLDYNITFTAYGRKGPSKRALLLTYVSGSSMYQSPSPLNDSVTGQLIEEPSQYGKRIGSLEILTQDDDEVDFKSVTTEFVPDRNGNAVLQFRVIDGDWYISDISVTPATDTGFSPSFFTFEKEMPAEYQHKRPETFEFMVEFYDSNNNIADSIAFNSGSVFDGANAFMSGNDNTMAGSLFIGGDTTSSGMHFGGVSSTIPETGGAGAEGSGFMRSVGYQGFISASNPSLNGTFGFMIYSGSVLPDSGDNYAGVGLELVGESGSLKFRTNPSLFEVQADAFFVGKTTTQFISGSGGAIEISSSGFHITPEGNVTASAILLGDKENSQFLQFDDGQLTVQGNLSVDQIFTPALIGGASSDITNASSSITSQGFAKFTSASIAGFDINTQAIVSSDSSLIMSSSGDITGSKVNFTGGTIGGFELSSNEIKHSGNLLRLKSSGQITGSKVNFIGGDIGGWSLTTGTIQGGNLILGKDGSIKSADYISDVSGFIISAEENGYAEFENIRIRGTMATTTFEKESVNAVGGQLFVANSTTISGSQTVQAADTTMSVANASGFTDGEVLIAKKVTNTGFTTEYLKVASSSLDGDVGNGEVYGRLYVTRSIGTSPPVGTDSGSVGDTAQSAVDYEPGQVLASTGRIGTGYIRINANPSNQATPYIDIIERTGSNPYDIELKARIGDLSGVAGTRNVPQGFEGFGLMSEVAFLSGSNIKLETPSFLLGDLNSTFVSGSGGKMEISSSKFHIQPDGDIVVRKVNATEGTIGGFTINDTGGGQLRSASGNFIVSGSSGQILLGGGIGLAANRLIKLDARSTVGSKSGDAVIRMSVGHSRPELAPFQINAAGAVTSSAADIAGFKIVTDEIRSPNNNLRLKSAGNVTASNADIKGDIKASTGFLQDVSISGLRLAPNPGGNSMKHDTATTTSSENFGHKSGSDGSVDDDMASGEAYKIETWWTNSETTDYVHGAATYRLVPNTTSRPHTNFSNWGWKFKVLVDSNNDIQSAINSSDGTPGYEFLENATTTETATGGWSDVNPTGMSFAWGHTLAFPGYDGPKDENGNKVSNVYRTYFPSDRYPGPTDPDVWAKDTGISNVIHRQPPIVGGDGNSLFDSDTRFSGFENMPQSSFAVHEDSGSGDFSPVFCFYTGSGIVETLHSLAGAGSSPANKGAHNIEETTHFTFISPMLDPEEFINLGSSLEFHVAPLWNQGEFGGNIDSMSEEEWVRYVNTSTSRVNFYLVERTFTGGTWNSNVIKKVSHKLMPGENGEFGSSGTTPWWNNSNGQGHRIFGWTKIAMNLSDELKANMNNFNSDKFTIVFDFTFRFTKDGIQDAGFTWDNLPNGFKGWAMTEMRLTKKVSTPVPFELGSLATTGGTNVGKLLEVGKNEEDTFEIKGYHDGPIVGDTTPTNTRLYYNSSTRQSILEIENPGNDTLVIDNLEVLNITANDNDLDGTYPFRITTAESSGTHILRFLIPDASSSPTRHWDHMAFLIADEYSLSDAANGTLMINLQRGDVDFKVNGDTEYNVLMVDASTDRVGILDDTPSYELDVAGTIRATGNVIAYSDERVKKNIRPIEDALFKVTQLEGVSFERKDVGKNKDIEGTQIGLIAQQVMNVVPEVVSKDEDDMYSLNYGNLAGLFVEAIKEQQQQIEELKKEIKELKDGSSI